ncbi:hypothetical protein [Streptomyces cyanogenus]|uniref:Uncharacterized protein n=1 Tax=Streptomyces cyanogenus TaxID=80860 RepID=A0ABX7TK08_STRCY|nr:hypothetical protein [Streptomyces cyanogenus]QTD97014.1 hypothetical protein S1361_06595 [Streptomyces cyanogenus]
MTDQQPDLDVLDALADAATPGPWTVDSSIPYGHRVGSSDNADWVAWTGEHGETGSEADAAYIAAMSPEVAKALVAEVRRLRAAMEEIRHLHKDSPMGPCPVCIDADAIAEGRDGLMPYPCPTGRLAGAQDCEPAAPVVRSAAD